MQQAPGLIAMPACSCTVGAQWRCSSDVQLLLESCTGCSLVDAVQSRLTTSGRFTFLSTKALAAIISTVSIVTVPTRVRSDSSVLPRVNALLTHFM